MSILLFILAALSIAAAMWAFCRMWEHESRAYPMLYLGGCLVGIALFTSALLLIYGVPTARA